MKYIHRIFDCHVGTMGTVIWLLNDGWEIVSTVQFDFNGEKRVRFILRKSEEMEDEE